MNKPTERDLQQLAEPTRSTALEQFRRLLEQGHDRAEAAELAFRRAEEWEASRVSSGATTPPNEPPSVRDKRVQRSS